MRKIKDIKLKFIDWVIIFVCLAGTFFCGIAFWLKYNQTLTKLNETPVAIITFKKNTAQRRFIDRAVWDRLKLSTPVYNGDTIRTIVQSEAIVVFEDAVTSLSLDENTMIQIFAGKHQGTRIDLAEGNLELNSVSPEQNIIVTMEDQTVAVNGQVVINRNSEGVSLAVIEGQASLNETTIESGNAVALDAAGKMNLIPMIAMTSFGSSVRILGKPEGGAPVVFSWNEINFSPDNYVIIEVARDRAFTVIEEVREIRDASSISIPLKSGSYRWRAYPANQSSRGPLNNVYPSGSLEIIPAEAPILTYPLPSAELVLLSGSGVSFSWSKAEGALSYLLEISRSADMNTSLVSRTVNETSVMQNNLDEGVWYWRVTPEYPAKIIGSVPRSAIGRFSLKQDTPPLSVPSLTFPEKSGTVSAEKGGRLLWAYDANAESWLVEIADNSAMQNPNIKQAVEKNYFSIPPELLQEGKTWYWRVTAVKTESTNSVNGADSAGAAVSDIRDFKIAEAPSPEEETGLSVKPVLPIIFFSSNTAETIEVKEQLFVQIASILNANPEYKIMVEGHANYTIDPADTTARLHEQTYELTPLSEIRAKAVAENLIKLGVAPDRINFLGIGGEKPLAAWEDRSNWWHNRRVEFVLEK